jgi:uncharacterized membrane protein
MRVSLRELAVESDWREEALRTNLWLIPVAEGVAAIALCVLTLRIDQAAAHGTIKLPSWVISGSPDAARQILSSLAGAIITVVGVVFSITIVTLTLASQQFGPRMLVTVALGLTVIDLGVLIYFIDHIATMIQLPQVIASIARDLGSAIDTEAIPPARADEGINGPSADVLLARLDRSGRAVNAPASGYLRFVRHTTLVRIATECDAVIRLHYRPGHFLTQGHPMATVWPPEAADTIGRRLESVHITGPLRTLSQDIAFGIDQLVEIAIRALSPAVNDTFTAMTCIDWLGDSLSKIAVEWHPEAFHRDNLGFIRVISVPVSYERLVQRSFEKIRQASGGMPAVLIRQLDALSKIMAVAPADRSHVVLDQAAMIARVSERTVPEEADRADISASYEAVLALRRPAGRVDGD